MPKSNKPPKYSKNGKYAVVYVGKKRFYLGPYGSPESKIAYARLIAEVQANPLCYVPKSEQGVTVSELCAGFLENARPTLCGWHLKRAARSTPIMQREQ